MLYIVALDVALLLVAAGYRVIQVIKPGTYRFGPWIVSYGVVLVAVVATAVALLYFGPSLTDAQRLIGYFMTFLLVVGLPLAVGQSWPRLKFTDGFGRLFPKASVAKSVRITELYYLIETYVDLYPNVELKVVVADAESMHVVVGSTTIATVKMNADEAFEFFVFALDRIYMDAYEQPSNMLAGLVFYRTEGKLAARPLIGA